MQDTHTSLGHLPGGKWSFDEDVTYCFEDMLQRSIPQYAEMRALCNSLARRYRADDTAIIDLGASRGEAVDSLIKEFGCYNRFVLVECSEPMVEALRSRYNGLIKCGVVEVRNDDLRHKFPPAMASIVLSVLTLQFVPIEHRQAVVNKAFNTLLPGGALILVEKVLGETSDLNAVFIEEYLQMKASNGYTHEEIETKRESLEGVLVPLTANWNVELLQAAGFREIDCFWRWMNFAGWIAVK